MSDIGHLLDKLFGRTSALVIMSVLAVTMAAITVFEAKEINPPTPFPMYQSWWFYGLLVLFCASILVVCLGRGQLRLEKWPLVTMHLGLVVLLVGGYLSYLGGIRGMLDLEENHSSDTYEGETPQLVIERDDFRRRVELASVEAADGLVVEGPGGGRYEVTTALESVKRKEDGTGLVRDPSGRGPSALFLKPEEGPGAWLVREGAPAAVGKAKARLTWRRPLGFTVTLLDARQVNWAASRTPRAYYSWIRIDDPDRNFSREWLVETNSPLVYRGYRFYQSGMPSGVRSIFQVTRDPGLLWVTIGVCLTGLGLLVTYALRFVRDPLVRRRRAKAVLAGEAYASSVDPEVAP